MMRPCDPSVLLDLRCPVCGDQLTYSDIVNGCVACWLVNFRAEYTPEKHQRDTSADQAARARARDILNRKGRNLTLTAVANIAKRDG
jgi:hypothetical protein